MQKKKLILIIAAAALLLGCCALLLIPGPTAGPEPTMEAAPTPMPTSAPTAEPAASPQPFEITERFFDDALFIGDSVTGMLYSTVLAQGGLGEAEIVYANSLGCDSAVNGTRLLSYQGSFRNIPEVLRLSGARKLFILLCANDLAMYTEDIVADWQLLIDGIREEAPEVDIYIQSGTPAYSGIGGVNNENILALNEQLRLLAEERDCVYVDIAKGMMDPEGKMREEYSSDHYIHFNSDGCLAWIAALKDPASYSVPPTEN